MTVRLMKTLLKHYGADPLFPNKAYPSSIGSAFEQLWPQFLKSKVMRTIQNLCANNTSKSFYTAQLFISHLQGSYLLPAQFDAKLTSNFKFIDDPLKHSVSIITKNLQKFGLFHENLKLIRSTYSIKPIRDLQFVYAYQGIAVEGHLIYKTKHTFKLDAVLSQLHGYLYKKDIPALLQPNGRTLPQIINSDKALWYTLSQTTTKDTDIILKISRAKDTLLIRYCVSVQCLLPYGSDNSYVLNKLHKIWPKYFKSTTLR